MSLWQLDAFKPPVFLGFVRAAYELPPQEYMGRRWLPHSTIDDIEFTYVLGANRRKAMATILSFDSEAPLGQRAGAGERVYGELPPIKRKMRLSEKEIMRHLTPRANTADAQAAVDAVYSDTLDLIEAVQSRVEWMSMQALSEDQLVYSEDDVTLAFDFGINGDFQWDIPAQVDNHSRYGGGATNQAIAVGGQWNNPATATYVNDLKLICDRIQTATGTRPTEFVCSLKAANYLLDSTEIKGLARGTAAGTSTIRLTPQEIEGVFGRYNLPTIVPYDVTVTRENKDGSLTDVRTMAENKAFLTQGRPVGQFLHGPTAESRVLAGTQLSALMPGIWANTYATDEPPAQWTKVAAVAFPTIPEMNRLGQMKLWT